MSAPIYKSLADPVPGIGLSLRDYFAAAAMQGMLANRTYFDAERRLHHDSAAMTAYGIADAMLTERAK